MAYELCIIRKTLKGRKQTNMVEGQCGTNLRLTRVSSGPQVSIAKKYKNETKTKMNISVRSQWPSPAVFLVTLTCGPDDTLVSLRYVPHCPSTIFLYFC